MRRLAVVAAALARSCCRPPPTRWTWPAPGDVLAPFVFGGDPYAGGQHRGIDVEGEKDGVVLAPASGDVAFAGSVGANGKIVTIETDGGYSVTLVQLGSFSVGKGDARARGSAGGDDRAERDARARCPVRPPGHPRHERSAGLRRSAHAAAASRSPRAAPPPPSPAPPTAPSSWSHHHRCHAASSSSAAPPRRAEPQPAEAPAPPSAGCA